MAVKATVFIENVEQNGAEAFALTCRVLSHDENYEPEGDSTVVLETIGSSMTQVGLVDAIKDAVKTHMQNSGVSFTPVVDTVRLLHSLSLA